MYVSFDDGSSWNSFQQNLPIVPITDLTIKDNNLIAATQGRSFWLIDDLTVMHQLNKEIEGKKHYLYQPMKSYRMTGGMGATSKREGTNHPGGVLVNYYVKDTTSTDTIRLTFKELDGDLIKTYSTHRDKEAKEESLTVKPGLNQFSWNMRYEGAKTFPGMILWAATTSGPLAIPGKYLVKMEVNGVNTSQTFEIIPDPRKSASPSDYQDQFDFLIDVRDQLSAANQGVIDVRDLKKQLSTVSNNLDEDQIELKTMIKELTKEIKTM